MTVPPGLRLRVATVGPRDSASAVVTASTVAVSDGAHAFADDVPRLTFSIVAAEAEPYAAVPTLRFSLSIECTGTLTAIRSVLLTSQIRLAAERRTYSHPEQTLLGELFGPPEQWGKSLRSLYWMHAVTVVPRFEQRCSVDVLVPCTYDFEVTSGKYLTAIQEGLVPLEFLFSGSVFYADADGHLQTARLTWDSAASYRMPVSVWQQMMQHYFPDTAWLRVHRDAFQELLDYRLEQGLTSWNDVVRALLQRERKTPSASPGT